jgi:hypothetical protein
MTDIAWRWTWPEVDSELLISQSVANVLSNYRQRGFATERGGQLFVDRTCPSGLLLALATPPHRADRAGRTWLELDTERCRQEVISANTLGLRLVGYWHTHPQTVPTLSSTDAGSFSNFTARYAQDLPHPLAIIVGKSPKPEGIKAWSFREGRYIEATRTE